MSSIAYRHVSYHVLHLCQEGVINALQKPPLSLVLWYIHTTPPRLLAKQPYLIVDHSLSPPFLLV